ncbi:MAG: prolipoprotein diacylglyceryl transferase [Ruminococcaceae bacterium]|nr:prolipoprotein diacylglyceryl transferase [Oscillospiraceae bacterium]
MSLPYISSEAGFTLLRGIMSNNISFLGIELTLYGLFFYSGIISSVIIGSLLAKNKGIPLFDIFASCAYTMIGAIIGSKLLFILVSLKQIITFKIPFINLIKGGFVFYGGLLGGILGLYIYLKQYKLSKSDFFDIYAVALPFGHAFGRIGCFFAGCCYGVEYNGPFSVTYTESYGMTPVGVPLLPIQILEAFCLVWIFALLLIIYLTCNKKGVTSVVYLYLYPAVRFILEFLRGDKERGILRFLSFSQIISLFLIISLTIFLIKKSNEIFDDEQYKR